MNVLANVHMTLKPGVNDPPGQAIGGGPHTRGLGGVGEVRLGRCCEPRLDVSDGASAEAAAQEMCEKLLDSTVIKTDRYEVVDA